MSGPSILVPPIPIPHSQPVSLIQTQPVYLTHHVLHTKDLTNNTDIASAVKLQLNETWALSAKIWRVSGYLITVLIYMFLFSLMKYLSSNDLTNLFWNTLVVWGNTVIILILFFIRLCIIQGEYLYLLVLLLQYFLQITLGNWLTVTVTYNYSLKQGSLYSLYPFVAIIVIAGMVVYFFEGRIHNQAISLQIENAFNHDKFTTTQKEHQKLLAYEKKNHPNKAMIAVMPRPSAPPSVIALPPPPDPADQKPIELYQPDVVGVKPKDSTLWSNLFYPNPEELNSETKLHLSYSWNILNHIWEMSGQLDTILFSSFLYNIILYGTNNDEREALMWNGISVGINLSLIVLLYLIRWVYINRLVLVFTYFIEYCLDVLLGNLISILIDYYYPIGTLDNVIFSVYPIAGIFALTLLIQWMTHLYAYISITKNKTETSIHKIRHYQYKNKQHFFFPNVL